MASQSNSRSPGLSRVRRGWVLIGVLVLANVLNFLDRQLLSVNAPLIKSELHLSNFQYGELLSAFSLAYAVMAPFAGLLLDRIGLIAAVSGAVGVWSLGSALTGFTRTFQGLLFSRTVLALGEAAALPCFAKATAAYLPASEWGFASTAGSVAVTAGVVAAPLLASVVAPVYGWRVSFLFSGVIGAVWVLLWRSAARPIPPLPVATAARGVQPLRSVLRDKRIWFTALAYSLVMAQYLFWLSWMTVYLVQDRHFSTVEANRYFAWIPPALAVSGGFLSAGLSFRWINRGMDAVPARMRICCYCAPLALASGLVPWLQSTSAAVLAIGLSLLFCTAIFTSLNLIPMDLFGAAHAGLTTSILASSYALMQTFLAPLIGRLIDYAGFPMLCVVLSAFPCIAVFGLAGVFAQPLGRSGLVAARATQQ